ncbi:MAG: undecaprenyldiphospho-muramoylpentapeptide beta-N-acetylglucosaminyltransferase [bacterium]
MRIIIAGGGTGGHLYPGICIAEKLQELNNEIIFIGTKNGLEAKILPEYNFKLLFLNVKGIVGKPFLQKIISFFDLFFALMKAFSICFKLKPDIVIGTGGYVSVPVLIAAWILKYPRIILEQNTIPGIANKILSHLVDYVCLPNEQASKYFKISSNKKENTGNPIRKKILNNTKELSLKFFALSKNKKTILFLGGGQGSHFINEITNQVINILEEEKHSFQIIHITGKKDYVSFNLKQNYEFISLIRKPFLTNIEDAYCAADLIISRSGAISISEIMSIGIPAIFIPFPYAANNHQWHNAKTLENNGAAIVLEQKEITISKLKNLILSLIYDENKLKKMSEKSKALFIENATDKIVKIIYKIAQRRR